MEVNSPKTVNPIIQKNIGQNLSDKENHKNSFLASTAVFAASKIPRTILILALMSKFKITSNLNKDEFLQVENGINKTLKDSGLAKQGVTILKYSDKNAEEISKILMGEMDKKVKFLPKPLKEFFIDLKIQNLKYGINAYTLQDANKILMPEKELTLAAFHEMGHITNNLSKIGKLLQKSRYISLFSIPIILIALLKPKKDSDKKSTGTIDKITDFIKYNAGKLTFLTILPKLAEEELASMKGNELAKKVLNESLSKKVSKSNNLAYITYFGTAVISSITVAKAVKEKDAAQ